MAPRHVPPSINETAFSCPHCGAFTTQYWYVLYADLVEKDSEHTGAPYLISEADFADLASDESLEPETKSRLTAWCRKAIEGTILIESKSNTQYSTRRVTNVWLSRCYACDKVAIWVRDALLYPPQKTGPEANADLPEDVLRDYEEAQSILALSPRGAAALLRLAIQKLCKDLGESGKDLNSDIASLVKKGLSGTVQKALDIVRVIGNEAVHPGTIDLRDDRDTALRLFRLVNLIAEQMISNQKHVDEMYKTLPPEKLEQIGQRDGKPR